MYRAIFLPTGTVCDRYSIFIVLSVLFSSPSLIPLRQFSKSMTHETKVSTSDLTDDLPV